MKVGAGSEVFTTGLPALPSSSVDSDRGLQVIKPSKLRQHPAAISSTPPYLLPGVDFEGGLACRILHTAHEFCRSNG
jgi:hypothetical protein